MKNFAKSKGKRITAALLCAVMCIMSLPLSAFAFTAEEGKTVDAYYGDRYFGSDGDYYYSPESYQYIDYDENGNTSLHYAGGVHRRTKLMIKDNSGSRQIMCIEFGIDYNAGGTYSSVNGKNSSYFQNLPTTAQYGIMLTSVYGWRPGKTAPISGTNEDDFSYATQTILWEYQQQLRTSPTTLKANSYGIPADTYYQCLKGRPAEKCYNCLLTQMQSHATIPSFASNKSSSATTYTLKYNQAADNYSLTLTDTNNTLSDIKFSASGITVSRSGNKYTFTSNKMIETAVSVTAQKNVPGIDGNFLVWGYPGKQTMMSGAEDPVVFYLKIKTETTGVGHIVKHSEDGKVANIKFNIAGNGVNQTVTTKADGTVDIELMPGVYTVTELTEDKYEPQNVQRVTIVSGNTSTVTFSNTLKRGDLQVIKSSEDNLVEGVTFHFYGTSLSGIAVDEYAVTDKNGVATFMDVLISGTTPYTIEEVDTAIRYVVSANQTAPVKWKEVTTRNFTNILKKFTVTVTKSDREEGIAQGNASLAGAVYGIYKGETLVDKYVTDQNGQFTTKEYVCDNDWTVREITPSEGYLLDTTIHKVGAEPQLYTVEHNLTANDVNEQVIKGNIAIIKHTDDGETKIETPESGATFEIYLKSAGSYTASEEDERDIIVCDENGFGQTKDMPYGVYTVHQTSGWEGRELMKDFEVFIAQNGQTYRYLINNANFESYIKVVKVDAESGKTIPYVGAGFQIYDPTGNLVTMSFTYPTPTTIDTFYTDANGCLVTPEKLEYGTGYSLVEVQAPYGYVLDSTPVYFDVMQDNATEESGVTVIKVDKPNMAQKGTITVEKTSEVFYGVSVRGSEDTEVIYQPIYEIAGLSDAVYEIRAAEDIITPDGTVRFTKGEAVDTVTTGEDGFAKSRELYLGKYEVQEIKAPYGMVLNDEIHTAELVYAGQETAKVQLAVNDGEAIENDLIYGSVSGKKVDENGELLGGALIGLFKSNDTEFTKENALMTVASKEDGSFSFEQIPFGIWYVREIEQPTGFVLNETVYEVNIAENEQIVEIEIVNEFVRGNITLTKVDADFPDNKLTGATFEVYQDNNADGKLDDGDTLIGTLSESEAGIYEIKDLLYGHYLVKESKAPDGFLLDTGVYSVFIETDGMTYSVENKAGVGFINEAMKGNLKIKKTSSDGKVEGFTFRVTGVNGYDSTFTTDKNGEIFIEGLRIGEYTVSEVADEVSAPYSRPADKKANVMTDSTTIVEMHNVVIDTPKTGDNSKLGLWLALLGISAASIGVTVYAGFKKKKKEDAE